MFFFLFFFRTSSSLAFNLSPFIFASTNVDTLNQIYARLDMQITILY